VSITTTVPVGQPLYGASFGQAVKRFFTGYVVFSGRASRSEFWWAMLFTFLVGLVVQIPFWVVWAAFMTQAVAAEARSAPTMDSGMLALSVGLLAVVGIMVLVSLAVALPSYAVMWRRLQDANFHGALALLSLVGVGIVPLVMCALPSNPAGVQYDPAYRAQLVAYGYPQQAYGAPAQYGPPPQHPYGQPTQQPYSQGYPQQDP
jgi:uncharacterized membrane protein YhaH (DUF805 family)